jgi:hypothetical protein
VAHNTAVLGVLLEILVSEMQSLFYLIFTFLFALNATAKDMDFSLQVRDLRPKLDLHEYIFADGDIVPGTAERFRAFLANKKLTDGATVILNSAGGSPREGMALEPV